MIEERHRSGACCDDLVTALGEDALAAREAGALFAFESDRADQRAVVKAGAVCGEALAVELVQQRRFARCEGAAAGCEGENKGNRYQAHGGRVAGTHRAGERVNAVILAIWKGVKSMHKACTTRAPREWGFAAVSGINGASGGGYDCNHRCSAWPSCAHPVSGVTHSHVLSCHLLAKAYALLE